MKVFMTGAAGFLMGRVARRLRGRGDEVVALVRDPARAAGLSEIGCTLVRGDLADEDALRSGLAGADAAIHGAAIYEVGIRRTRRAAMYEANVSGAERVLKACLEAGTRRVVHVSTIAAFGNTRGRIVDERDGHSGAPYTSYYEETKHRSHEIAVDFARRGLPLVIVQPGQIYGPGDHSGLGRAMQRFVVGRLPAAIFGDLGLNWAHVDDVSQGILLALDRGRPGEAYVLGGEIATSRQLIDTLGRVVGRRPRIVWLPDALLQLIGRAASPLREIVSSGAGVTFLATDAKARRELGYAPRTLEVGLRDTFAPR